MQTICDYLAQDHERCDALFLQVETSIVHRDWAQAELGFQLFCHAFLGHLDSEEGIVFPALERALSNASLPVAMLRMEHERMRGVILRLADALERHDQSDFALHAETLTLLAQQHSLKEEDLLYPMLDRILSGKAQPVVDALREAIDARSAACAHASMAPPAIHMQTLMRPML